MLQDFDDKLSQTSTASNESQKIRTELCKYYMNGQHCPYSINCYFAHGEEQLQSRVVAKNYRTKPCQNFMASSCKYGQRCQFAHKLESYQLEPLKYWTQVECIEVGTQKKKCRLQIFKRISSGNYNKQ